MQMNTFIITDVAGFLAMKMWLYVVPMKDFCSGTKIVTKSKFIKFYGKWDDLFVVVDYTTIRRKAFDVIWFQQFTIYVLRVNILHLFVILMNFLTFTIAFNCIAEWRVTL